MAFKYFRVRKPRPGADRNTQYHTITDIVSTVYCEQKVVFDQEQGGRDALDVKVKAMTGTFEHWRFQAEGKTRAAIDRRCFIATAVYGVDAPETEFLRMWRDKTLSKTVLGRFLVRCYYVTSPAVVRALSKSVVLTQLARACLNLILRLLGMRS